tara:strand:- start:15 stop:590 length:576 start_codon:yes stop_codon:yes gene_type:complete
MTTGLVVVAKNDFSHQSLVNQFQSRKIKRKYEALVWNNLAKNIGIIETFIGRSSTNRKKMAVTDDKRGRESVTNYRLVKKFVINDTLISHCECNLQTGRTHQIRVHMKHIGNPLIGDNVYCNQKLLKKNIPENISQKIYDHFVKIGRHALHAKTIGFVHPVTKKTMYFDSELPRDMEILINSINSYKKVNL